MLVHSHGPFAWGTDAMNAVHSAVVLEEVAFMDWHAMILESNKGPMQRELLDRHYLRKHGKNAYYGQAVCWPICSAQRRKRSPFHCR